MYKQIIVRAAKPNAKRPKLFEVYAHVFGPVAVHENIVQSGWRVTHVASGYAVTPRLVHKRGAMALAKRLAKRPNLWKGLTPGNISKYGELAAYYKKCRSEIKSSHAEEVL